MARTPTVTLKAHHKTQKHCFRGLLHAKKKHNYRVAKIPYQTHTTYNLDIARQVTELPVISVKENERGSATGPQHHIDHTLFRHFTHKPHRGEAPSESSNIVK